MKIIAWNCNMAFRRKEEQIFKLGPDILVVPECEHPDKLLFSDEIKKTTNTVWIGKNLHKGLGVFSFNKYRIRLLDCHNTNLQLIAPVEVTKGRLQFILFAVWANNPADPDGQYVEQVWKAIHHYDDLLANKKTILAGDFNSNTIWDRPRRKGNHSAVVDYLQKRGIESVYHNHFKQVQGKEQHATQYMYRHQDKPYHLDYCFASKWFSKKLSSVEIGDYKHWIAYSDHMPVTAVFTTNTAGR